MASVNKVILVGHLGKNPEIRYMPSGKAVTNITIATSDIWKDKITGAKQERTEWHNIVLYSPLAEIANQYLQKGSLIFLEGRLQTRKWIDKNGQERYTTEVIGNELKMLSSRQQVSNTDDDLDNISAKSIEIVKPNNNFDDDIPF